jgi:hypothetical protein
MESHNAAVAAALKANPGKRHIVTSSVEHSSVLKYCMALGRGGFIRRLTDHPALVAASLSVGHQTRPSVSGRIW